MTHATPFHDLSVNDQPRRSYTPPCPSICNGRTFKLKDIAIDTTQILLIGLVAYGIMATYLNPSENSDLVFAFCVGEVALNLTISTISEIFYCIQGCRKHARKIVNPFILSTVATFGSALGTEVSYALAERTIRKHPLIDFSTSESSDIAHAYHVFETAPVKEMWMAASAVFFLALGYEGLIRHFKKVQERRGLLEEA